MSLDKFGKVRKEAAADAKADAERSLPHSVLEFPFQVWVHRAHVVMLTEVNVLKTEEAAAILRALEALEEKEKEDPHLSVYANAEAFIIAKAGDVGGKMHTGRSRNDLSATVLRMLVREQIDLLTDATINFCQSLLERAEQEVETVMPGYTVWQHAQPVTLAHYLLAHVEVCHRTLIRLQNAYALTNLNPLGAAALAGTEWPIDRNRTTELLGFDGLVENTQDCVASRDFEADAAFAAALHLCNLSRLATDLQTWMTFEYGMLELDESYAVASSIMPQKKNPSMLEIIKARAATGIGTLTTVLSSMKSAAYANVWDTKESIYSFTRIVEDTNFATRIMAGVVSTLTVNRERMLERAAEGYGTMTQLTDTIVRKTGLSFRQAHEVVADVVVKALEKKFRATQVTSEMIDEAALTRIGRRLGLDPSDVTRSLDPVENVKVRGTRGGPAPVEVRRAIREHWEKLKGEKAKLTDRRDGLEIARKKTDEVVHGLTRAASA